MLKQVRVTDRRGKVLAVYPIDYDFMGDVPDDRDFIAEAMKCATEDKLARGVDELRDLRFEVLPS